LMAAVILLRFGVRAGGLTPNEATSGKVASHA
jgi:hypothetical protein